MAATTLLISEEFLPLPELSTPPPPLEHDIIRSNILELLFDYTLIHRGHGLKVLPSAGFSMGANGVFGPDASVVALSRVNPKADKYVPGAPDLAIEVISPTDLEIHLRRKIDAYLTNGSQSVWIVYPGVRSVVVYRADGITNLKANQPITDPLLPGFSTPVSAFFELT